MLSIGIIILSSKKAPVAPFCWIEPIFTYLLMVAPRRGMGVYFENPPPNRRFKFRDAKCARQIFMIGGASSAGHMKVYFKSFHREVPIHPSGISIPKLSATVAPTTAKQD